MATATRRIYVGPHDVAAVVDPRRDSGDSSGENNRGEFAPAQQKAVHVAIKVPISEIKP